MTETTISTPGSSGDDLRAAWESIFRALLHEPPAKVMSLYDDVVRNASSPVIRTSITHVFGPTIRWAHLGEQIREGPEILHKLAEAYATIRNVERDVLVEGAVAELIKLGCAADDGEQSAANVLASLGDVSRGFILTGTPQQLFIAHLSIRIGLAFPIPVSLRDKLALPLVDALSIVLELGAPVTRDMVVEGLGALQKHCSDPNRLPPRRLTDAQRDDEGDSRINRTYEARRERRASIILAIAGDPHHNNEYWRILGQPVGKEYDRRADFVRALPAVCRQAIQSELRRTFTAAESTLVSAAAAPHPDIDAASEIVAAFARYQETVFSTIDVMLDRGMSANAFETVIAKAVRNLRTTIAGPLNVSNAQVRATIAILCTAAKAAARLVGSKIDDELKLRYMHLSGERSDLANPGIIEGCFRGLPLLLWDGEHNDWTRAALYALFAHLKRVPDLQNTVGLHSRLCAHAALRRVLVALAERLHRQFLEFHDTAEEGRELRDVEYAIRQLFSGASPDVILDIFQRGGKFRDIVGDEMPRDIAEGILSTAALERDVLQHATALFSGWKGMSSARQLLLIRILSSQLRALSHDDVEMERYEVLRKILKSLAPVSLSQVKRHEALWKLVAALPPGAAEAVDADLQDFVENRSGHLRSAKGDENDLPGYVLSMVSADVSYRLAADIARQVALNRERARLRDPDFDFAIPLYHITLRGPSRSIFDHLLARIGDEDDRAILHLFRDHVTAVEACQPLQHDPVGVRQLVTYAKDLIPKIARHESRTLRDLAVAMKRYLALAAQEPDVWKTIIGTHTEPKVDERFDEDVREGGGLNALFVILDRLANDTHASHVESQIATTEHPLTVERAVEMPRDALAELCYADTVQLRVGVEHYLGLPVSQFEQCSSALHVAIEAVERIEKKLSAHPDLQPPERVILLTLLRSWKQMFAGTAECWVKAPRRTYQARRPDLFWTRFVERTDRNIEASWIPAAIDLEHGHLSESIESRARSHTADEADGPLGSNIDPPPIPPGQDLAFERFCVEWMASELDVDDLQMALSGRWKRWFRVGYKVVTNAWLVTLILLAPFVAAAVFHYAGWHEIEGLGFFVYTIALVAMTLGALIGTFRKLFKRDGGRAVYEYRFHALLPRLFRLIVVPLALVVDFEHSYLSPMHASNSILFILMLLALLTTAFFIRRELRTHENELTRLEEAEQPKKEWRRVTQVVSIALAHAFAVSILFSFLFENSYISRLRMADQAHAIQVGIRQRDVISGPEAAYHHEPYFCHFLPREAPCDLGFFTLRGWSVKEEYVSSLKFDFYPTVILAWTALGLFFGVFLEGFLKGERLRGVLSR